LPEGPTAEQATEWNSKGVVLSKCW